MKIKKNLIVTYEKIKEKITPYKFKTENIKLFSINKFFKLKALTAPKVGIDIKKEIFADSTLLKENILAAVIVTPDLLTPDINDKT
jgi:hypothetical protein